MAERGHVAAEVTVEVAFVDQGDTGMLPAADAVRNGIRLEVVKLPDATRGFVLSPHRWLVERVNAWLARFRCLARDDARLAETLAGLAAQIAGRSASRTYRSRRGRTSPRSKLATPIWPGRGRRATGALSGD